MIPEKFLGNSLKKVTTVEESGEIPHFCYLGMGSSINHDIHYLKVPSSVGVKLKV